MTSDRVSDELATKLEKFYGDLTPGRLELLDVDGLAFAITATVQHLRSPVTVSDETLTNAHIEKALPCRPDRPHDWKMLDSGHFVCMWCGNHREWLVDKIKNAALDRLRSPATVGDEIVRLSHSKPQSVLKDDNSGVVDYWQCTIIGRTGRHSSPEAAIRQAEHSIAVYTAALAPAEQDGSEGPPKLPERCPHCGLNWSYNPPAITRGTNQHPRIEPDRRGRERPPVG